VPRRAGPAAASSIKEEGRRIAAAGEP